MINRIVLAAASATAALALAAGLALSGFGPGADQATAPVSDPVVAATDQVPAPVVQVDTVYVAPEPTPQEIVVTEVRAVAGQGGEHEGDEHEDGEHEGDEHEDGEHEGEGDD